MTRSDIPSLRLVEAFEDGIKLLALAERFRLEGIVSKRKPSPYRSGPSRDWCKDQDGDVARSEPGKVAAV